MFIDKVKIKVKSGKGGNGAVTFRREKFVAFGGPDGGDGGKGGSIYLEATNDMNTLLDFQYESVYQAENGERGARKNCNGKCGEDLIIKVPCGTVVSDPHAELTIADLTHEGDQILVAEGGRGGKGNAKFKSGKNRVPGFAEPGDASIERELILELKMIADVGIIGFPNAGKSTLISKMSAAKPKIADYAFTTLKPNLGVVKKPDGNAFVLADIPGLIEGASEGQGLGHEFLRHVERTRLLIHVIDAWGFDEPESKKSKDKELLQKIWESVQPLDAYQKLNTELEQYSSQLAKKPQILVLNKIESYPEEELNELVDELNKLAEQNKNNIGFLQISAFTGEGVDKLKDFICEQIDHISTDDNEIAIDEDHIATNHDDSHFDIEKAAPDYWNIYCGKLERIMKITDLRDRDSLEHLFKVAKSMGIFKELVSKGAEVGHTLNIDGVDFEIDETTLI